MSKTFSDFELAYFNGADPDTPVYLAVKNVVYDVSAGRNFYGPGGPYECFAGRECSRALALMQNVIEECNGNLVGLDDKQLATLQQWIDKFKAKYPVVGNVTDCQC
eukprot:gene24310-9914_t